MKDLKVVFMGTPEFSVPTLKAVASEFNVVAVVTAPDKPRGRGRKLTPTPVKSAALELGLEVLEPESLKDNEFAEKLKELSLGVTVEMVEEVKIKSDWFKNL